MHSGGPPPCRFRAPPTAAPPPLCLQPPAPRGSDVRSSVRQLIAEAQRLPSMPAYISYDALLADLRRWVEALEACSADIATAHQVPLPP